MTKLRPAVLFLCTRNSCRSQMAEGFLRKWGGDQFEVYSAGLNPADAIHPLAVQVMDEVGIDLRLQTPDDAAKYFCKVPINLAVIVCADAEQNCPRMYLGASDKAYWPFEDPAVFVGSPDETLSKFREVRDQIGARIKRWLTEVT